MIMRQLDVMRDWPTIKKHAKVILCEDTKGIVAEENGEILAAFIADSWSETSVQVHQMVLNRKALREGIHRIFANWIFGFAGMKMMIGLTPGDNEKAIRLNRHYGFKEFARVPDAYCEGVDYIIFHMTADECNYFDRERFAEKLKEVA
jgi:hypothetical protein